MDGNIGILVIYCFFMAARHFLPLYCKLGRYAVLSIRVMVPHYNSLKASVTYFTFALLAVEIKLNFAICFSLFFLYFYYICMIKI